MYDVFVLLRKFHTTVLHLSIFILLGKNGKSLCKSCNFFGHLTSTSRIYPLLVIVETLPNHINYLRLNIEYTKILHFYHNFSCIYYLLSRICVLNGIFNLLFLLLPLITYHNQLIILILCLFFLNMLAMLILVMIKNEQDQVHKL